MLRPLQWLLSFTLLLLAGHSSTSPESTQPPELLSSAWQGLAAKDPVVAYRAIWQLVQNPGPALKLLRQELVPAAPPDDAKIAKWLTELASDTFAVREKATRELEQQGELAEPALSNAFNNKPDLETRRRLEKLLDRLRGPLQSQDKLRQVRAVETLELIASAEAKEVLQNLTKGHPSHRLTRESQESLTRLQLRGSAKPWQLGASPFAGSGDPTLACVRARFGTTLFRHHDWVRGAGFCADNRFVVTRDQGGSIYLWEAQTGELHRKLDRSTSCVAASAQGTLLAFGLMSHEEGSAIVFWDWQNEKELGRALLPPKVAAQQLAFTPDGKQLLAITSDNSLRFLDPQTQTESKRWQAPPGARNGIIQFSIDGQVVLLQERPFTYTIVNLKDGKRHELDDFHYEQNRFAFSPDSKLLATGSELKIWDVATGQLRWIANHSAWGDFKFDASGKFFAASDYQAKQVSLWDPPTGRYLKTLARSEGFEAAAFSSDSRWLAAIRGHVIRIWDLESGQPVEDGEGHFNPVDDFEFFPELGRIVSKPGRLGSNGGAGFRFWEPASGQQKAVVQTTAKSICGSGLSSDGTLLAVASHESLDLWDVEANRSIYQLTGHAPLGLVTRLVRFSADGRYLWTWGGSDFILRKWEVKTGKALMECRTLRDGAKVDDDADRIRTFGKNDIDDFDFAGAAFTPQGGEFILASRQGELHVYDVETGKRTRTVEFGGGDNGRNYFSVVVSPNGKHFAAFSSSELAVHDLATGKAVSTVFQLQSSTYKACFSPDGRTIAVPVGNTILAVELATGRTRLEVKDLPVKAGTLAFSPEGKLLITAMNDTTSWLWDLPALAGRGPK
jgi:WD40 repeat protein